MKTKELIKMLQEEDPDGESHIRINGDPIIFVDKKPGYWDGPYSYLETENNKHVWVQSTKGSKVDINTLDLFDFAELYKGDWKEMKNHIRIEYDYLDDGEKERMFLEKAKKECEEYNEIEKKVTEMMKIKN